MPHKTINILPAKLMSAAQEAAWIACRTDDATVEIPSPMFCEVKFYTPLHEDIELDFLENLVDLIDAPDGQNMSVALMISQDDDWYVCHKLSLSLPVCGIALDVPFGQDAHTFPYSLSGLPKD